MQREGGARSGTGKTGKNPTPSPRCAPILVDRQALLLAHEHRQIEREAVRVIHAERVEAWQDAPLGEALATLVQFRDASLEGAREDLLLPNGDHQVTCTRHLNCMRALARVL